MSGTIVPIVGMHRSGTSALAGALHTGGISMGPERHFLPKPLPENPQGFFEDYRFRRVNDLICRHNGYEVTSWEPPPDMECDGVFLRFRRVLLVLGNEIRFSSWGWKDPRTCLTLGSWISTLRLIRRLAAVHAVFVFREPMAVADSLRRREGLALRQGLDLWYRYNRRALRSVENSGVRVSFLEFADLLQNPRGILDSLSIHLPGLDPEAGAEFIDPGTPRSAPDPGAEGRKAGGDPRAERLLKRLRTRRIKP